MQLGQVPEANREDLTPGTVIDGFTDYGQVKDFVTTLADMLHTGRGRHTVKFRPILAEHILLIANTKFRNREHFNGRIIPEKALIIPTDASFVPGPSLARLQADSGISFLLRYILKSTGKDRYHVVECSLFRKLRGPSVEAFAREYDAKGGRSRVARLIEQATEPFAQRLREGLAMIVSPPR